MPMTTALTELYRPVQEGLDTVRLGVESAWDAITGLVEGRALPYPAGGGKMLRPALCLLSAGASGVEDFGKFSALATSMELLHLAALTHDDFIDSAHSRRGARSLNALWDDRAAILSGDYLVARAVAMMCTYGQSAIVADATDAIRQMTEGELFSLGRDGQSTTREECLDLARKKTASLFAMACGTPCHLVEGAPYDALRRYGMALGVAFQLVDDLLDLTQEPEAMGKPACGDLVEGKTTLPILLMRERGDQAEADWLGALRGAPVSRQDRKRVGDILVRTGAHEATQATAREYADQAREALDPLPANASCESMVRLVDFVLTRGA